MPYGSGSKMEPNCSVTLTNTFPGGQTIKSAGSFPNAFPMHNEAKWSRSGTNASAKKGVSFLKHPGTLVRVAVTANNGPRLPYKVWSKRLKKYVWARAPMTVYRLKRVKSKVPLMRGLDLPPNPLNFSSNTVYYYGDDDGHGNGAIIGTYSPQWIRKHEGALWSGFNLNGGFTAVGPNPQNYTTKNLSSRFASAVEEITPLALSKLYEKTKRQNVNFAQAIAERRQTAGMILDLTGRLVNAVVKAKHGNLVGAAKALFPGDSKALANNWLIYQYGIRPLLSDLEEATKMVVSEPKSPVFDVVARRTKLLPRELIAQEVSNNNRIKTTVHSQGKVTVLYKCRVEVTDPFGQVLSETGLSDPLLLGWELLPYSFVVDWLLPVGNYLKNRGAFANLRILNLHKTVYQEEHITYERQFLPGADADGYVYVGTKTVGFLNVRRSCVRTVITTGLPALPFPSLKDPVSPTHIANAIALLRQLKR